MSALVETINKQFDEFKQKYMVLTKMANSLPQELASKAKTDMLFRDIKIAIPYDLTVLRQTRKLLGKGWKLKQVWGSTDPAKSCYQCYSYAHPNFADANFWIMLEMSKEGSTCRLEEVGEKTEKVYKVVCS